MPIEGLPALADALSHIAPWLGGGIGGDITLKKPLERLLGAPIERILSGYEARTEASKKRTLAIEEVHTRELVQQEEEALGQRALARIASTARREQENVEAVAVAAIEDLKSDPPPAVDHGVTPEVDDDFLAQLQRAALDASTERIQLLYGRILAGEIRSPGSFSLSTLQTLSVFDHSTALLFERWAPRFNSEGFTPNDKSIKSGVPFEEVSRLAEAGLINTDGSMSLTFTPREGSPFNKPVIVRHGNAMLRLSVTGNPPTVTLQVRRLTNVGTQICRLTRSGSPDAIMLNALVSAYKDASSPNFLPEVFTPMTLSRPG